MISWRIGIVMRCAVWFFCCPQKMHMLFQSCLGMMPLSTVSCSRCPLVPLWVFFKWNSPYVSSPFYWSIASSSGRSSSSAAPTWFAIQLGLFFLYEYIPLPFFLPEALVVFLVLKFFALIFFVFFVFILSFLSYWCAAVVVVVIFVSSCSWCL